MLQIVCLLFLHIALVSKTSSFSSSIGAKTKSNNGLARTLTENATDRCSWRSLNRRWKRWIIKYKPEQRLSAVFLPSSTSSLFFTPISVTRLEIRDLKIARVHNGQGYHVTDGELRQISLQLFDDDHNRAIHRDVIVKPQAQVSCRAAPRDLSPDSFFTMVKPHVLSRPTYVTLMALLGNYVAEMGIPEVVTRCKLREQDNFLEEFWRTKIAKDLFQFLKYKGVHGCTTPGAFKRTLKTIWFGLYSRANRVLDSSGFEHVFVGETKGNKVFGLHNWVQFYLQENARRINYYGYVTSATPRLYSVQLKWNNALKRLGTTSIGTSPEYELAVFTLCFMARVDTACQVDLRDGHNVVSRNIQTFAWKKSSPGHGLEYVASAYFTI